LLTLSALVFFWLELPIPGMAGISAAALDLVNTLKDDLQGKFSLKDNPVYFLARLDKATQRTGNWDQRIERDSNAESA